MSSLDYWTGLAVGVALAYWAFPQDSFFALIGVASLIGFTAGFVHAILEDIAEHVARRTRR